MKTFSTLGEVLLNMDQLSWEGTLYTNKNDWARDPHTAKFIYLEGDDEIEDYDDPQTMLPRLAEENNTAYFLNYQLFDDVISKQRELDSKSDLHDFIRALNHYREYDSFYWPMPPRP